MDRARALHARIRLFYDPTREPLRRRVYTTLLAIVGLAATAGLLSGSLVVGLSGPLALALMVPATEAARRLVTPVADPIINDTPGKHAVDRAS